MKNTFFKISNILELRLEDNKTNIYVNGKLFKQCKYLLINIPVNKIPKLDEIESIDETAHYLDDSLEGVECAIPPRTEFWGHCSNLQAWYENGYDTRILRSNMAFPLLKKLSKHDPKAKYIFEEELIKRLNRGHESTRKYLFKEYGKYILKMPSEKSTSIQHNKIKTLKLNTKIKNLPRWITQLENLQTLYIENNKIKKLPEDIGELGKLRKLSINHNRLKKLPGWIARLKNLRIIDLSENKLKQIPEWITQLKELRTIDLRNNKLKQIPEWITQLKELRTITLYFNNLSDSETKKLEKMLPECEVWC